MNSRLKQFGLLLLPILLVLTTGADHRDAPGLLTEPAADINDVYAFVNKANGNVVLAMTVNPFTAPGLNAMFSPDCLYQFKIDTNSDGVEDLVIQVTFDAPNLTPNSVNANPTASNPAQVPSPTAEIASHQLIVIGVTNRLTVRAQPSIPHS